MSLKAKLEAVIYAAEEPVTLSQLAQLFAIDAMEWKAAQAAAAAEQTAEVGDESLGMPLLSEGLEFLELENSPAIYAEAGAEVAIPVFAFEQSSAAASSIEPAVKGQAAGQLDESAESVEEAQNAPAPPAPVDAEAESRRVARQRDREVKGVLKQLLDELVISCTADERGVEIREIAGGYRMATKPECHDAVRMFVKSLKPAMKLSLPALETLAVIAYKQPVTAPEVNEIRGVESAGVLGSLLARKLIATAGRKPVIGRPILYKTTKEFLLRFGLKDVSELPSMEEFEKMAAIELEEMEPDVRPPDDTLSESEANAELDLESNSPSGEELAEAIAETNEADQALAREEDAPLTEMPEKLTTDSTAAMAAEPSAEVAESTPIEAAPAEPDPTPQAETEISAHGDQEDHQEL